MKSKSGHVCGCRYQVAVYEGSMATRQELDRGNCTEYFMHVATSQRPLLVSDGAGALDFPWPGALQEAPSLRAMSSLSSVRSSLRDNKDIARCRCMSQLKVSTVDIYPVLTSAIMDSLSDCSCVDALSCRELMANWHAKGSRSGKVPFQ